MRTQPAWTRRILTYEVMGLLVLFLFLSCLAFRFPPSGDDWAWGSTEGIERLRNRFAGYNGRYMGNLAVLLLTRTTWLTPFVVAATLCLLLRLLVEIARVRTPVGYLVGAALLLAMPLGEWRQTVAWVSGFSNYALASFFMLVFVAAVQRDWARPVRLKLPALAVLLVFVVAGQLFMEHVTLYILGLSLLNVALQLRSKSRTVSAMALTWGVGAVIGTVIMFSNSAYRSAAAGGPTNQGFGATDAGNHPIWSIVLQATGGVSQLAVTGNLVLNWVLFGLLLVLLLVECSRSIEDRRGGVAAVALAGFAAVLGAAVNASTEPTDAFGSLVGWSWIAALAQFAAVLLAARHLIVNRERAVTVTASAGSVLVLLAPIAAVTPYGPRNFLPCYLLLVAITLLLLGELQERVTAPIVSRVFATLGAVGAVSMLVVYFTVYSFIDQMAEVRLEKVRQAASEGASQVRVRTLPFPEYVHSPDPLPSGPWEHRYKAFYELPQSLQINLVDPYQNRRLVRPEPGR